MSFEAPASDGTLRTDGVKVLVADDNPTNVFILAAMLRSIGLAPLKAVNGVEAVQIATERLPALIFMDVQMPGMDGIAAARRIHSAVGRQVAVVAVTAFPEVRQLPDFEAAEFDDFLVKPVEFSSLRRIVDKWLHGARANGQAGAARP